MDYLTIVGHKFYGPRIGALYVKDLTTNGTPYHPLLYGGGQERGYRPGSVIHYNKIFYINSTELRILL